MENKGQRYSEIELIKLAKKDPQFFAPLYSKYYKSIFIFIFKKIQNEHDTSDLCSNTFTKALLNLDKYEDRGFPFSSWLYRIAANEVNLFYRSSNKIIQIEIQESTFIDLLHEVGYEDVRNEKQKHIILKLLSELPSEQSQLIEMRFFEKISFKDLGTIFNSSEASIKMKVYRILEKLKKDCENL